MIPCCLCGRSEISRNSDGHAFEHKHSKNVESILCSICSNLLLNNRESVIPWSGGLLTLKEERERKEYERQNPTIRRRKRRG